MNRIVNGIEEEIPKEEELEILAEWAKNEKEALETEYLRKRQAEYPSLEKQIEIIRTQGIQILNDTISAIDIKYPFPVK